MKDAVGMTVQLASNAVRFGLYYGVNLLVGRDKDRKAWRQKYEPKGPMPSRRDIFSSLRMLLIEDAKAVRDGLYPPMDSDPLGVGSSLARIRQMLADLPDAARRRKAGDTSSVRSTMEDAEPESALPDYFLQDFHYQTGGYLTEHSARLYDAQVETLFYGAANAMRRAALRPIAAELFRRDQRHARLLDVACGTGRFIRQVRLAFPALPITGADMSRAYLDEARRHLRDLRAASLIETNAEALPLESASQDIVTAIFLFHELPGDVRRRVTREIARVLKPGGLFVFIDSLQLDDRPGWNGLIEMFPERFHEPYYAHYVRDDLKAMFAEAGLTLDTADLVFLAKMMVCRKPA